MTSRLVALGLDCADPVRLGTFWAGLLDRQAVENATGVLLAGVDQEAGLQLVRSRAPKLGPNRTHLHLTSATDGDQQRTVEAALRLGAQHLDVGQRPDEGHVVLADPEGNELCVIEAGNRFLAGCGLLGEVACDGSHDVGLFWSRALGWPLVWDFGDESAVQSPAGGTKIGWGGLPDAPLASGRRQRFLLAPTDGDQAAESHRLVAQGATWQATAPDGTATLTDPDGNEFLLQRPPQRDR